MERPPEAHRRLRPRHFPALGGRGTGPIARIDIIKDNTFVYAAHPNVEEVSFSYTDRSIEPGTHYYYVRVIQADDNMAWASPIWVHFAAPRP